VILSAQTTDEQVNMVTQALFLRFPTANALAAADLSTVEEIVHPLGFYHVKARHIVETAKLLVSRYDAKFLPI